MLNILLGGYMKNKTTYIFGHKNPDTDSVCAAISLSYLKNKLGMNTIPTVLGNINEETNYALNYFKIPEPIHLNDVKLQIKDVSYHKNYFINGSSSIKETFTNIINHSLTGIPVINNKNEYYGYISLKEIAKEIITGDYHKINTSYNNLISVLKGKEVLKYDDEIIGKVIAATYAKETFLEKIELDNSSILIVGDRKTILEYAIDNKIKLIITVMNVKLTDDVLEHAKNNKINIISTPLSSYEVGKTISLSNYVKNIIRKEGVVTVNEADYLSDFFEMSKKLKHTNYPVLDNKNICKGLLTLTDCNEVNRKKVILVDHNNSYQSVDGLEEAEILEIIDHHNIGGINTKRPINFRNTSSGSTNTIIYDLYKENKIKISKDIAGIMASAIISDTLLLTSPTTTNKDIIALEELSKMAKINYKKYGMDLLKHGMSINNLTEKELLYKDFKSYRINDEKIGIGQLLTTDIDYLNKKIIGIIEFLNKEAKEEKYKVLALFVSNIFENKTYIIYNAQSEDILKESFKLNDIYEGMSINGVLSRKGQIVPYIMSTIEKDD